MLEEGHAAVFLNKVAVLEVIQFHPKLPNDSSELPSVHPSEDRGEPGASQFRTSTAKALSFLLDQQYKIANGRPFPEAFGPLSTIFLWLFGQFTWCKKMLPIIKNAANIRFVSEPETHSLTHSRTAHLFRAVIIGRM